MTIGGSAVEHNLAFRVAVSTRQAGADIIDHAFIEARLAVWRSDNTKCGLTGALLMCDDGIVHVLEGTEPAIQKQRNHIDRDLLITNVRQLAASSCLKRRFGSWPLAYVPSSRWVKRALADRPLADMAPNSSWNAKFLIDLVLDFVGDGA